jgi:hypothetical protein
MQRSRPLGFSDDGVLVSPAIGSIASATRELRHNDVSA